MKFLYIITIVVFSSMSMAADLDETILLALQKRVEITNPDSAPYLSEKEKQEIERFLKENAALFESLGKNETFYYIELLKRNSNPSIGPNIVGFALSSYAKHFQDYSRIERLAIESDFAGFVARGYMPKQWKDKVEVLR